MIIDSDNGGWKGSQHEPVTDNHPLRGGKMNSYEGGIRIPFLIRGPNVPAGSTCDTPINLIDLYPTFMEMAGVPTDSSLKLDGCNILPLIEGTSEQVVQADGKRTRYPLLVLSIGEPYGGGDATGRMETGQQPRCGLRREMGGCGKQRIGRTVPDQKDEQGSADLGEQTNLADKFPKIRDAMLREMDEFLNNAKVSMPYKNINAPKVTQAEKQAHPQILELGSEKDQIWATFESGNDKATIKEAHLLYTLNPKEFDKTRGHREEWFKAPAKISNGRVEASTPRGNPCSILHEG